MAEETPALGPLDQAYAQLLAEASAASWRSDWTVSVDATLCARLARCTLCGRPNLHTVGTLSVWGRGIPYAVCAHHVGAAGLRQLERLFIERYRAQWGNSFVSKE